MTGAVHAWVRFPDNIAHGATGGPKFATTVVATGSGHEKRDLNWAQARGRWDVASGIKKRAQIDDLIPFFRARQRKAYSFQFKDRTDHKATGRVEIYSCCSTKPMLLGDTIALGSGFDAGFFSWSS